MVKVSVPFCQLSQKLGSHSVDLYSPQYVLWRFKTEELPAIFPFLFPAFPYSPLDFLLYQLIPFSLTFPFPFSLPLSPLDFLPQQLHTFPPPVLMVGKGTFYTPGLYINYVFIEMLSEGKRMVFDRHFYNIEWER